MPSIFVHQLAQDILDVSPNVAVVVHDKVLNIAPHIVSWIRYYGNRAIYHRKHQCTGLNSVLVWPPMVLVKCALSAQGQPTKSFRMDKFRIVSVISLWYCDSVIIRRN